MVNTTDVFIIGGGPAGLATAIAARQRGFEVIVADGATPPIDKPCGEGLMPDSRAALCKLGIEIPAEDSHPFRGIRFLSGDLSVDASFPSGTGIGVRRTVLHRIMIARAEELGIRLLWQTPVTGLQPESLRLGGGHVVRARWIVGADGVQSLVRQWAGLDNYRVDRTRFAFRRHYRISPWTDCMELHWGPKCQVYVTPVAADEVCVALISRDPHLRLDAALTVFPELLARLRGAEPSAERGAISSTRKLNRVHNGRVALVGDASGVVDAITGEGLCLSLLQAEVLADCFAAGSLKRYQPVHRDLSRRPALMARLMLTLDWKVSLRQRAMRAFDSDPRLFERMLSMHVGALSPIDFVANGLSLGWRMLNA
jgi:flavin-dependent dehydrogenase